jgi:hypothetical protein
VRDDDGAGAQFGGMRFDHLISATVTNNPGDTTKDRLSNVGTSFGLFSGIIGP